MIQTPRQRRSRHVYGASGDCAQIYTHKHRHTDTKWRANSHRAKTKTADLTKAAPRIDAVGVLLAVGAYVPLLFADEARRVRKVAVVSLRLGARPEGVLRGAAVETDARALLTRERATKTG